jgi:hypothetical protein
MSNEATEQGGWKYYQIPRSEFYEELSSVLSEFSDFVLDDPIAATKLDQDIYNDWFYCGYDSSEGSFRVSLWPAYLPVYEGYQEGEISEEEFKSQCWPKSGTEPVTVHVGGSDDVIEIAEDPQQTRQLADSLAEFAGIELVDDWDDVSEGDLRPGAPAEEPAGE